MAKRLLILLAFLITASVEAQYQVVPMPLYTNANHTVLYMGTVPPGSVTPTNTPSPTNTFSPTPTFTPIPGQTMVVPVVTIITSGSGSVSAPTGALYCELLAIGGAGGSQGGGEQNAAGNGSPTTIGSLAYAGGGGGAGNPSNTQLGGIPTPSTAGGNLYGYIALPGTHGGSSSFNNVTTEESVYGAPGAQSYLGGAGPGGGSASNGTDCNAIANTGSSGGGGSQAFNVAGVSGASGASGGVVHGYFVPTPIATYSYVVGSAGVTTAPGSGGSAPGTSAAGEIILKWFYQ